MYYVKKTIIIFFIFLSSGCGFSNISKNFTPVNNISIETPNDRYNAIFKENLNRKFKKLDQSKPNYLLKTNISFDTFETISINNLNALKFTKAKVKYSLINTDTNEEIKSGTIYTFPALNSASKSLYTNEINIVHVKERLSINSASKLHLQLNLILQNSN